jgi:hypothetical protein
MVGCSTINGEVYKMGSDTFSVSGGASGHGSIPRNDVKARDSAYQTAQAYCSKISKNMLVITEQFTSSYAGSTMNLAFRCLSSEDQEFKQRPLYNVK